MSSNFHTLVELFNKCLKKSCFPDCWKVSSIVHVFKNVGERSTAKNYRPISLLSVVSKVFEKHVNNRIVDHLEKCDLFSDFWMVLGLLDQLQIFSQLYLIKLLRFLTGLGLLELWHLSRMEFQVRYLTLFLLFSVIDGFVCFWIESLHKNIQLMLEFLKGPLLVLHFSCCILMTFLMMLSVMLLSMLMILLSILSVIKHMICGKNWGKKWLVDFNSEKTQLVSFDCGLIK